MHVHAALLLGDVAGRIGRVHEVLDRAAAAADLDETDAHADVENLVLPDEAVVVHRTHHVVRDLPRLLERTTHQQQRELVAADASRGVGVAHRLFDDGGDLAQHVVAGGVPAGVVHHLEPVEVQVAQGMGRIARLSGVHRLAQPALELAPVHEAGERIVTGLIGHLPGQAPQLAGIVHDDHEAERFLGVRVERRHADLHRVFRRGVRRHQNGAPAHGDRASRGEGLADRIAERTPVRFVDERGDVREELADDLIEALAEEGFGGVIDIVDPPFRIDRDDALAHGIERRHGARFGGCADRRLGDRQHFQGRDQQRRLARAVDERARQLDARHFPVQSEEFDFVAFGGRLARKTPVQVAFHQLDIFRRNEVGQRFADGVRGSNAQQGEKTRIGEQDVPAVNQHGVVHRLDQALKELLAVLQAGAALVEIFQQFVDRGAQLPERAAALELDAAHGARLARELHDLLGKVADGALLAAFADEEHTHTHR